MPHTGSCKKAHFSICKRRLYPTLAIAVMILGAVSIQPIQPVHAQPTWFDHIVIIAMENQNYADVMGSGTGSSNAPFLRTMLAQSSTIPNYHSYGANPPGNITGCSAACYTAVTSGATFGSGDNLAAGSISKPNIFDKFTSGLTWKGFCENGCSRGPDHFPPYQYSSTYQSPKAITTSVDFTSQSSNLVLTEMNSASPANYIWLTPTDSHNMHDNTIQSGDAYLQQLLVGTGTLSNPATGSLFSTNLFTNPNFRTLLYLWWDEWSISPNLQYGTMINKGFISSRTNYDEYATLHTIESNWGFATLTNQDVNAPVMTDLFATSPPPPNFSLSASQTSVTTQLNQSGTSTITVTPSSGFTGTVSFTTSITPTTGLTCQSMASVSGGSGSSTLSCMGTTAQSYTVTVTGTSGSLSHQISVIYTVTSSSPGNFGNCTSLPQGWNCGNTNGLSGSYANIVNGVLQTRQLSQGVGSDSSYYYATSQKGTFPWSPCQAPANGVLPTGLTVVNTTFTPTVFQPYGTYRYHIDIALYYYLPNGPVTSQGHTYQCLDTQSRVENINGVFSAVGTSSSYDAGDSFGYDRVSLGAVVIGQTYTLSANVANQCQQDLAAWTIPTNTPCQLSGVEIGIEGFQFTELDVNFQSYAFITSAPPFDYSLSNSGGITVQQASSGRNTVTATLTGGTSQSVTLSCVTLTLPTGASCSFNPATVTPTASTTLTVSTTSSTPTGTYQVQVTGSPLGATTTPTSFTLAVLSPRYTLTLQGFDYDGGLEETLTLNGQRLTQLPAVDSPQNAGVYISFTVDMTSLVVHGANTLVFTHANWDCGVVDSTKNVQITDAAGNIIFSDPTERPLSCTQSITYQFNA